MASNRDNSMKLLQADASPFARKARIVIRETGLESRVEEINPGAVTPVSNNVSVNSINPLGMIPALETNDGNCIYDSSVICEYLNNIGQGSLYPDDPDLYFHSRKLESLADGIMDLSVALRYETALRPAEIRWSEMIDHTNEKIERALDQLEKESTSFNPAFTIGEITVACALGYRDFRFPEQDWRIDRPALTQWFGTVSERESFTQTTPTG